MILKEVRGQVWKCTWHRHEGKYKFCILRIKSKCCEESWYTFWLYSQNAKLIKNILLLVFPLMPIPNIPPHNTECWRAMLQFVVWQWNNVLKMVIKQAEIITPKTGNTLGFVCHTGFNTKKECETKRICARWKCDMTVPLQCRLQNETDSGNTAKIPVL